MGRKNAVPHNAGSLAAIADELNAIADGLRASGQRFRDEKIDAPVLVQNPAAIADGITALRKMRLAVEQGIDQIVDEREHLRYVQLQADQLGDHSS